jgi:glucokinase
MPRPKRSAPSPKNKDRPGPVLGVDLGATKVVSGLVSATGEVVRRSGRIVHANDGPDRVIRSVETSVRAAVGDTPPADLRIGIAVAAQVDPATGRVVYAPNLGWRDVPLARRLSAAVGAPVTVINDARAAALGEWKHGVGIGATDLFCLSLGTGVGGSAVVGGRLLEGGQHALGEVGHLTIVAGGRRCHCPNSGCLEAYVGGWAIAGRAQEAARTDPAGARSLIEGAGSISAITAATVFESYRTGDAMARRIVSETERFLGDGAVSISNAFNPSLLVVTGGLIAGMPHWVPVIESAIRARCQPPAAAVRVVRAALGENAALVGAACAVRGEF